MHPGQLQNIDASAGAEQCLPFEGPFCPVLPLFPASSPNPSRQNTPCLCSWESESLTSLVTVWFLQTIHSKHATEGTAPGDTNIGAWSTLTWSCLVCGDYWPISAQEATRTHSLFLSCSWYSSPLSRAHKASGRTWLRVNICFAKGELKISVCQRVCPKHTQGFLLFPLICYPDPNLRVLLHISHKVSVIKNPIPTTFWQWAHYSLGKTLSYLWPPSTGESTASHLWSPWHSVFLAQCHASLKNGHGPVEAAIITKTEISAVQGLPEPYES